MRCHTLLWFATDSVYWSICFRLLLQYTRNSHVVGLDVGVRLYLIGTTTTRELVGPLRSLSSDTLVVLSSGNGSVLLLAILNKKVESNVTASTAVH